MSSIRDLCALLPELYILIKAFIIILIGVFRKGPPKLTGMVLGWICVLSLFGGLMLVWLSPIPISAFHDTLQANTFTVFIKSLILISTIILLLFSLSTFEQKLFQSFEFPLLMLFSVLGMMIVVSANDFLVLFMGMELQALPLYVLVAFCKKSARTSEASIKYFILGALSTGLFLFGVSLIYGLTGHTNFSSCQRFFEQYQHIPIAQMPGAVLGVVLILVALGFKSSLAPFHMWTPDVYEGTPTPVTLFLASAAKVTVAALALRLLYGPLGALRPHWQPLIAGIAALSMTVGAFGGLAQSNIKRLIAYSTIGHMGTMFAGIATGSAQGFQAVLVYLTLYMVMTVSLFAVLMVLKQDIRKESITFEHLRGLATTHPLPAGLLALLMFSLAGIPPLSGFFGKMAIFYALLEKRIIWLACIGVLSSVIACFYYLRIVKVMYFEPIPSQNGARPVTPLPIWHVFLLLGLGTATACFALILPMLISVLPIPGNFFSS